MKPKTPDTEHDTGEAGGKPYVRPELREFGDVADLTRSNDAVGMTDGGKSTMTKT